MRIINTAPGTAIDWSTAPPPWNKIGLAWAQIVRCIAAGDDAAAMQLESEAASTIIVDGPEWRRLRKAKGLTQYQLAKLVGVTGSTISTYETNRHIPSQATCRRLLTVLDSGRESGLPLSALERAEE